MMSNKKIEMVAGSKSSFILVLPALIQIFFFSPAHCLEALSREQISAIEESVKRTIRTGQVPGAVILIGNREKVLYRRALGLRAVGIVVGVVGTATVTPAQLKQRIAEQRGRGK